MPCSGLMSSGRRVRSSLGAIVRPPRDSGAEGNSDSGGDGGSTLLWLWGGEGVPAGRLRHTLAASKGSPDFSRGERWGPGLPHEALGRVRMVDRQTDTYREGRGQTHVCIHTYGEREKERERDRKRGGGGQGEREGERDLGGPTSSYRLPGGSSRRRLSRARQQHSGAAHTHGLLRSRSMSMAHWSLLRGQGCCALLAPEQPRQRAPAPPTPRTPRAAARSCQRKSRRRTDRSR